MSLTFVDVFASNGLAAAPAPSASKNLRASRPAAEFLAGSAAATPGTGNFLAKASIGSLVVAAAAAVTRRAGRKVVRQAEAKEVSIPRPEDMLTSEKFPLYMGSTSGYFSRATKERHAITWTAKEAEVFEMPTTGWAIMNKGENLCYFRKKEHCIALGKALRKMKIDNYKVYRIKKDGTVIFMHPADGVFPEKVNKGRIQVNGRPFSAGSNPQQALLKWTKYNQKPYEADPLTCMFVKARLAAWADQENLFPLPQPEFQDSLLSDDIGFTDEQKAEYDKQFEEATNSWKITGGSKSL